MYKIIVSSNVEKLFFLYIPVFFVYYIQKLKHDTTLLVNMLVIISRTLRAVICDLGTYGDFSIEYDNNNNKSNFDLKQATNALLLYILSFTVCTP